MSTKTLRRELAHRNSNGVNVSLYWDSPTTRSVSKSATSACKISSSSTFPATAHSTQPHQTRNLPRPPRQHL